MMAAESAKDVHMPVLLEEALSFFPSTLCGTFVDATLGMGGHSEAILMKCPQIHVLGIDQDQEALAHAKSRLSRFGGRVTLVHSNFEKLSDVAKRNTGRPIVGIFADLGVSSLQLDSETRGFSFRFDAPLDMRMDPQSDDETVADILSTRSEQEIANIIYQFGEERASRKIARWIVERRESGEPITTTTQLASLVVRALGGGSKDKIHPATRTFQAFRIAVNRETEVLEKFINDAVQILDNEGIMAAITFHSLEDRIVKRSFLRLSGRCSCPPRLPVCICGAERNLEILTKKPIVPSEAEMRNNSRSRSAKLRAAKKIAK
ncbi:16S rRNA (cytosine(1402)-N(4))-methyltransferase RsmH [soil metagenome]